MIEYDADGPCALPLPSRPKARLELEIEAAKEPSHALDLSVLWEVFPPARKRLFDGVRHISTMTGAGGEYWYDPLDCRSDCPRYTGDLNAALDVARPPTFSMWTVTLNKRSLGSRGMLWTAEITIPSYEFRGTSTAGAALAVCAAVVRCRVRLAEMGIVPHD